MFSTLKLFAVLSCVLAVGCTKVNSTEVPTDKLIMTMSVEETESEDGTRGIRVGGQLTKDIEETDTQITIVELSGGETLEVEAFGETRLLEKRSLAHPVPWISNAVTYGSDYDYSTAESPITIRMIRTTGEILEASIGLPAAFELSSPTSDEVFSASNDDIELSWEPIAAEHGINTELGFQINGTDECLETSVNGDLDDNTGSYTIPAGELVLIADVDSCTAKINVFIEDKVNFDYNDSSSISAKRRSVAFELNLVP